MACRNTPSRRNKPLESQKTKRTPTDAHTKIKHIKKAKSMKPNRETKNQTDPSPPPPPLLSPLVLLSPPLIPPIPFPLPPAVLPRDPWPQPPAPLMSCWQRGDRSIATVARLLLSAGAVGRRVAIGEMLRLICVGFGTPALRAQKYGMKGKNAHTGVQYITMEDEVLYRKARQDQKKKI